jgi:riboflavin kinase/FMN adenylyltransferase
LEIFNDLSKYTSNKQTIVTLGTFDGVHLGHQKVLKKLVKSSKQDISVLLTFFPHPRMVLQSSVEIKLINTIEERISLLENTGLDVLVIHKFTKEFSKQSALEFVRNILVAKLNISKLIIGYDHHFGKNREGNFEQLEDYSHTYGFGLTKISKKDVNEIAVSSTKIRKSIEEGNILKANKFLGYNFMLTGEVVKGENLGEKIGFPTANLFIKETYKLIPKTGSYIVKSILDGKTVYGMMNIGFRPTLQGKHKTIEIHFFDFNKVLYGKTIRIELLAFLRNERKFETVEALKNQLQNDKEKSLEAIHGIYFDSE